MEGISPFAQNNGRRKKHNFDIILYDHGLYRTIPKPLQRNYAKLWLAVIEADESNMRRYSYEVAGIDDDQFPLFASAITGRDYISATKAVVSTRTDQEKEIIGDAMGDGLLSQVRSIDVHVRNLLNSPSWYNCWEKSLELFY